VEKAEKVWWKRLLREDGKAPHFIKVDWDKWVDEDEDKGTNFWWTMFYFFKLHWFKLENADTCLVGCGRNGLLGRGILDYGPLILNLQF